MNKYTIIRPATREGWLALRSCGIGSSEVGTILGLNPYETAYQLWRRKKGLDAPLEENEAMRAGHILEPAVATYFEQETGRRVIKSSQGDWLAVDCKHDFLRVSPDRTYWLEGRKSRDNKGILECKTTQMDIDPMDLPKHWFCQLMYQLGVMGYRQGTLAWLTRGVKFGYVDIKFDAEFYSFIVSRLTEFWQRYILGAEEPPVTTVEDISVKFRFSHDKAVEADPEVMEALSVIKSLKPQIDELTAQKKEAEDKVKVFMKDADCLTLQGSSTTLATWRSAKPSRKFDADRFKAEHPDLYDQYLTEQPGSRRFIVK